MLTYVGYVFFFFNYLADYPTYNADQKQNKTKDYKNYVRKRVSNLIDYTITV